MTFSSIFDIHSDEGKLALIEFLVLVMAICLFLVFVLDSYRYRSRSLVIKIPLLLMDSINSSLLEYTIGLIQFFSFSNELYAIWAVLLSTARSDTDYVTAYGIPRSYARRRTELADLLLSLLIAYLNVTVGSKFKGLLWALWSVRPLQVFTRIYYYDVALNSYSHGRNSEFVAAYSNKECLKIREDQPNPTTMQGYGYFVWGENAQEIESKASANQFNIDVYVPTKCITVEKIWQCRGRLLSSWDKQNEIKDVCLSYALYKILRCRVEDIPISRKCCKKMQNLIFGIILSKEKDLSGVDVDERIFRIFEIQTAFLNDYKGTRYPIIISYGFPIINLITLFVTTSISLILAFNLHKMDFPDQYDDYGIKMSNIHIDRKITYVILCTLVLKEIWHIILCVFSDWTKIRVISKYCEGQTLWRNRPFEHIAWYLCRINLVRRWYNKMPQYNILQSFNYRPYFKRVLYYGSMHIIAPPMEGGELLGDIKIYREIKRSIGDALRSIYTTGESMEYMRPVYRDHVADEFKWACHQDTCSHLILVWHIATSMCEIGIYISDQERTQGTRNCFSLSLSWIKNLFSCKPFLVDLPEGDLRSYYISANAISHYCAYLLICAPELLPGNKIFSRLVFEDTVKKLQEALTDCDSLNSIYEKLKEMGEQRQAETEVDVGIVKQGARLGYALISSNLEPADRWKMLSQYWADLLLYLAPSYFIDKHEYHIQKGGEFITILWALFTHSGIFERREENQAAHNEGEAQGPINVHGTVQSEEEEHIPGVAGFGDQNLEEEHKPAGARNSDPNIKTINTVLSEIEEHIPGDASFGDQNLEEEHKPASARNSDPNVKKVNTVLSEELEQIPGDASFGDQNLEEEHKPADARNSDQNVEKQQD